MPRKMAFDIGSINLNFYTGFLNIGEGRNSLMRQKIVKNCIFKFQFVPRGKFAASCKVK